MHTQEFTVTGMTCNNCRLGVLEKLSNLPEVAAAEVDLASGKTQLEVHQKVTAAYLSAQLGDKYSVDSSLQPFSTSPEAPSKLQQLFPLFLIFGYLIAGVIYLNYPSFKLQAIAHDFMGLFFIVFSFFKFLDYKGFPASFARYDPIAKKSITYAKVYPFIELGLGVAFLLRWQLQLAIGLTFVLLLSTTIGVLKALIYKRTIDCACLGTALKLPMTEATLIENLIMLAMCVIGFFTIT